MVKHTITRPRLEFMGRGRGLAVHAGARLLADLADRLGLTAALSGAMSGVKARDRGHDWGRVLADGAVMIADGGESICDIAALAAGVSEMVDALQKQSHGDTRRWMADAALATAARNPRFRCRALDRSDTQDRPAHGSTISRSGAGGVPDQARRSRGPRR